jgi:hypothetical protein
MSKELGLLNFICLLAALGFLALAIVSVFSSGDFLTIDNLFIIAVSMLMALLFAIMPLMYLRSEGKLPIPGMNRGMKRAPSQQPLWGAKGSSAAQLPASTPPLLDAKGRAVPPDVKAIMARMGQTEARDA